MANDPYKYFRIEARELTETMGQEILALEKGQKPDDAMKRLLRAAHTLKGAARVVKQVRIAELAHDMESHLADSAQRGAPEFYSGLLHMVDEMSTQLAALQATPPATVPQSVPAQATPHVGVTTPKPAPPVPKTEPSPAAVVVDTARVDIGEMDRLLAGMTEASVRVGALQKLAEPLAQARRMALALAREVEGNATLREAGRLADGLRGALTDLQHEFTNDTERLAVEMRQLAQHTSSLRLVPATTMFSALERSVRDAAHTLGKDVSFVGTGGSTSLDGHVLAPVSDALLHVVRNAVAHGIEGSAERAAVGKPAAGVVTVHVERRGSTIVFTCHDDGRGIDVAAVKAAAVRQGHLAQEAADAMADADAMRLIFSPGLTTASVVTEVAGRGVGLDAVDAAVTRLKGRIEVSSVPQQGTKVTVTVPMSLTSVSALVCAADEHETALLPLGSVKKILRLEDRWISRGAQGETLVFEGQVIPFVLLAQVLGKGGTRHRGLTSVAVVAHGASHVALGVHGLHGIAEVVVRSIPAVAAAKACVAGVCLDGHGNPRPMLDPQGLIDAVRQLSVRGEVAADAVRRPILVIDDSLTTRMLEQSILQSAGYEVELATSGEEGLTKAKQRAYGLFIVDVEMPGISGFEFVERTRADTTLRQTPAVLVTSLSTPEDKRRGLEAGAHSYIVKGEFHQDRFLNIVRDLVG